MKVYYDRLAYIIFVAEARLQDASYTKLGLQAQTVPVDEPTMKLDLSNCVDDRHTQYRVLREFGCALGLAYQHQHPEYLRIMNRFIDIEATMDCYGIKKLSHYREKFGRLTSELFQSDYAVHSIMHYP